MAGVRVEDSYHEDTNASCAKSINHIGDFRTRRVNDTDQANKSQPRRGLLVHLRFQGQRRHSGREYRAGDCLSSQKQNSPAFRRPFVLDQLHALTSDFVQGNGNARGIDIGADPVEKDLRGTFYGQEPSSLLVSASATAPIALTHLRVRIQRQYQMATQGPGHFG